mgnify:CR=1 FL=1
MKQNAEIEGIKEETQSNTEIKMEKQKLRRKKKTERRLRKTEFYLFFHLM